MPVSASVAAAPAMKRILFCSASGATARPAPDEVEPAMILYPWPIRSFAAETAFAGSVASSTSVSSILWPLTVLVPFVAYSSPYRTPWAYMAP